MIKTKTQTKHINTNKTFNLLRTLTLAGILTVMGFPGVQAFGQSAVLIDGTVLTLKQPVEPFATEGPMWDIDVDKKTITVTGKTLTFPLLLNGESLRISGSSALGQDGEAATGIGADNFDRLLDINATFRDISFDRQGAARSLFSTSEAGRTDATAPATRNPTAYNIMEANYFKYLQEAYAVHAAHLPADFLERAGIRQGGNTYPVYAGGTLKSAGHTYVDATGNEYLITDIESVIELSENVASGKIKHIDAGDPLTGRPPSFVIGDLLMIFNQDPRFGAEIFGIAEMHIPMEIFVANATGLTVDTIGHTVGEHVLFVQELITEMIDPSQGIIVATERWQFDDGANQIRFRGVVSEANFGTQDELALEVEINDGRGPRVFSGSLLPPAGDIGVGIGAGARPGAEFDFRSRDQVIVANVTAVTVRLRYLHTTATHAAGDIAFEETILRILVEEE
ncbi:MAG: hypothetical protein ACE5FY_06285 [Nitrospiria bacterium]